MPPPPLLPTAVTGLLKGYDQLVNLVLDDATYTLRLTRNDRLILTK